MKVKKGRSLIVLALATLGLTLVGTFASSAKASMFDSGYVNTCVSDENSNNKVESGSNPTTSGATGDWTQKGTDAYKTAEQIFKYWPEKHGFSGAASAGIVGNVAGAEDPSMKLDQKEVGGSGGGLYQFTPYTKYLESPKSDKSWSVENQSDVVYDLELKNDAIKAYGLHLTTAQFGQLDDPAKAAEAWERGYERPRADLVGKTLPARQAAAQKAYEMFGGANIKANSALLAAAGTANGTGNNGGVSQSDSGNQTTDCSNGDSGSDAGQADGDIVKNAKALMGWFHYSQGNRTNFMNGGKKPDELKSKSDLNKDGNADCSSFVWLVLKESGCSVPANVGWYTKTMADDAKGPHKWFKQIDPKDAKPGDVIIVNQGSGVGNNGHTAIISENWHGYDTKCINEGGDNTTVFHTDGVVEDTIQRNFGTMLQGSDVVIARPVKASGK